MINTAIFAAGCFWGIEEKFLSVEGVVETEVGYVGGKTIHPTYWPNKIMKKIFGQ